MATRTLIQMVNDVGEHMRRSNGSTYTSLTQSFDTIFITRALNQAKRFVEDNWKWDELRTTVTFNSVASQHTYDTSNAGVISSGTVTTDRSYVVETPGGHIQFWDVTSGEETRLRRATRDEAEHFEITNSVDVERPGRVAVYPNGSGLTVHFPYAPTAARQYRMSAIVPQDDLALTTDTITIPFRPVVLMATALAFDERGEELGGSSEGWWDLFRDSLGSAKSIDQENSDLVMIPV
jgi:hypothetical protein